jgi:hypothetical protein
LCSTSLDQINAPYRTADPVSFLATVLLIAAVSVTQLGPEAKRKGLDELAPPTG